MMTTQPTSPYSREALQALEQLLQDHQSLLWVDPTTNSLSVKRITQPLKEDELNLFEAWQE